MSTLESMYAPQQAILAEIALLPVGDEDDDFETLSVVGDVTANVLTDTSTLTGYRAEVVSDQKRAAGVILLLGELAHQAIAQKDFIIAFLQAGVAVIGVLAKQKRVSHIEMQLNGDSISIENPDTATVQTLLDSFEAKHPGRVAHVTSSSKLHITGRVSKHGRPRRT